MEPGTGKRLRSLYAQEGGVTATFTSKVDDYVAARPTYPRRLFAEISEVAGLGAGARVVDVGAGTGLFTAGLLECGYEVLAVEPNEQMRAAADQRFRGFAGYASAAGTAEALPLPAHSVDLVTAAQAFHWFDVAKARAEFLRVLRPGGCAALVWNDRLLADPLHQALDEVFAAFGGERRSALAAHEAQRDSTGFFGASAPTELRWPHEQLLPGAGLQSLVFSRSYMPGRDSSRGEEAARAVREVFRRFARDGVVPVRYVAVARIGRLAA